MRPQPSAVKQLAVQRGLELFQPPTLKSDDALARLRAARPQVLVVAAYGMLLPPAALEIAPLGAINIHASLLPRWRGAAPIQRALLAGDAETGISIMQMDAGLDTGPVLMRSAVKIEANDDAGSLHDKLAAAGVQAIVAALAALEGGHLRAVPQPAAGVTYAAKIDKRETRVDWSRSATEIERQIRAFRPQPGVSADLDGESVKLWQVGVTQGRGAPGTVLQSAAVLEVACGEGALSIDTLQRAGGKPVTAADFLRGKPLPPGTRFG